MPLSAEGRHVYGIDLREDVMSLAIPIPNEDSCSSAACHAHDPEQTVLGVLDVELSTASIQAAMIDQRNQLWLVDLLALAGVLLPTAWKLVGDARPS